MYYWRAMSSFKEFGVSDWAARVPSASGAFLLVLMIFVHMRRFRPGGQLDAALITASSVAIIGFARGASTDMQMAAPLCIGMLGWYAWYETGLKFWLFDLYFFGAAATLAKGPIAPFLALCIILLFLGLRREWSALRRTIWVPGVLMYLAMVLPWYIAVQRENPTFVEQFFVEHNLERFATNLYQHHQPFWYYLAVALVGLMPWTVIAIRALVAAIGASVAEWKVRLNPKCYLGLPRAGDAFPEFLVLWALFPIVFFTCSKSKLPGYILPAIPPLTILTGDYLNRIRRAGLPRWLLWSHAAACALVAFVIVLAPQHMVYDTLVPPAQMARNRRRGGVACVLRRGADDPHRRHCAGAQRHVVSGAGGAGVSARLPWQGPGPELFGPPAGARDAAEGAGGASGRGPGRQARHGLRPRLLSQRAAGRVRVDGVPAGEHLLVVPAKDTPALEPLLAGRVYQQIIEYPARGLQVYKVYAKP